MPHNDRKATLSPHNGHAAFTLSEVLITLGIIGVVAVLTVPTIMSTYRKHLVETRLSHTYAMMTEAFKFAEVDYGDSTYWAREYAGAEGEFDTIVSEFFNTYFIPYVSGAKLEIISGTLHKYGYDSQSIPTITAGHKIIRLNNGVFLFATVGNGRQGLVSIKILIDINGPKPPNVLGNDLFQMIFSLYDGELFMSGEKGIIGYGLSYNKVIPYDEILSSCCTGDRTACGAVIKQNGWKIPKEYPLKL